MIPSLMQFKTICMEETGITEDEIPRPPSGSPPSGPPPDRPEPSQKLKCFLACLLEKGGLINSSGDLQVDKIPIPGVDFTSCKNIEESDKCNKAFLMEKCVRKLLPRP
ncbi:general odorant-binding protein 57c [Onthophagus taurus]|uniref:general odorant-binding protein 57c n=1 Tax=Onthophagus taurus TaxID=166361 RepID=UPI0039BE5E74